MLFVSNLISGVDQYKFPSLVHVRSYNYPIIHNQIMQVAVLGTQVVIGGDDGFARLFDTTTGRLLDRLNHSRSEQPHFYCAFSTQFSLHFSWRACPGRHRAFSIAVEDLTHNLSLSDMRTCPSFHDRDCQHRRWSVGGENLVQGQ